MTKDEQSGNGATEKQPTAADALNDAMRCLDKLCEEVRRIGNDAASLRERIDEAETPMELGKSVAKAALASFDHGVLVISTAIRRGVVEHAIHELNRRQNLFGIPL